MAADYKDFDTLSQQLWYGAEKALAAKDDDKALGFLNRFLDMHPDNEDALRKALEIQSRKQRYGETEKLYVRLLGLRPDDPEIMLRLGDAKNSLGSYYDAEGLLSRALASGELSGENAAHARHLLDSIYDHWELLKIMQDQGDHRALDRFFTHHINKGTDNPGFQYALRGFSRHWLQNGDAALADMEKALSLGGLDKELEASVRQTIARIESEKIQDQNPLPVQASNEAAPGDAKQASLETGAPEISPEKADSGERASGKKKAPAGQSGGGYNWAGRLDRLLTQGDFSGLSRALEASRRLPANAGERGVHAYFQAELAWQKGDHDRAHEQFMSALPHLHEKYRRSAALMRIAEYHAIRGEADLAADHVERSTALLPGEWWKMEQAGGVYARLAMHDKAIAAYHKALELRPRSMPESESVYRGLAEACKAAGDTANYLRYAQKYVEAVNGRGGPRTEEETGTAALYQAALYEERGLPAEAYSSYERASRVIKEKYALSETFMKMAQYMEQQGNRDLAASYASSSADLLPGESWRVMPAASILTRTGRAAEAEAVLRRGIEYSPEKNGSLYRELTFLQLGRMQREKAGESNRRYIDYLTARKEALGSNAPKELVQELFDARSLQTSLWRTWGFDSYFFGSKQKNGDYSVMMINELYRNYTLPNGMWGKVYGRLNGTITDYYSGSWYDAYWEASGDWESRSHLDTSLHGILGVSLTPVMEFSSLSLSAEYLTPIGHHKVDDDFRLLATIDKSVGDTPRPFGNRWNYAKTYDSVIYSTRDNDFIAFGEFRLGQTLSDDSNRNLLMMPYVGAKWSYDGKDADKGRAWGLQAGPGLAVRLWYNEDKYHAPRSYIDAAVYYHWGVSHRRENSAGFNLTFSF